MINKIKKKYISIVFGLNFIFFHLISFIIHLKYLVFNDDILFLFTRCFHAFNNGFIYIFGIIGYYIFTFLSILLGCYFIFLSKKISKILGCLIINFIIFIFLFILSLNFISLFYFANTNYANGLFSSGILFLITKINIWFKILLFLLIFSCFILFIWLILKLFLFKKKSLNQNHNSNDDNNSDNEMIIINENNELKEVNFKDLVKL